MMKLKKKVSWEKIEKKKLMSTELTGQTPNPVYKTKITS
jgi:hypothetical protein